MRTARLLRWALLLSAGCMTVAFVAPTGLLPGWTGGPFVSNLPLGLCVAVLVHRLFTHPAERRWVAPICLGTCAFLVGADFYFLSAASGLAGIGPLVTQIAYLAVYPLLLAGILLALSRRLRHARLVVGLDGLTGAMAGAAVTAAAVAPLVARVWDGSATTAWSLTFVFGDLLLVAASLGALAVVGITQGRNFALWTLGMLVYTVGDIVYAYLLSFGDYQVSTWLDTLWVWGLALIAVGATMRSGTQEVEVPPARSFAVVSLASVAAVTVLTVSDWSKGSLPSVLALVTLALCGARFALGFLQLRELAVVREQAMTDELTGLANRRALYVRLDDLLGSATTGGTGADPAEPFALVLVDLDRFKEVNDSLGHATGDELLRAVVTRFASALEDLDTPSLLTRLGGDEFAVVLSETTSPGQALAVGEALQASLAEPVQLGRAVLHVRASIGVAVSPEHGVTRSDILFAADAAMYSSKTSGAVRLHAPDGVGDRRTRLAIAEELHTALEKHELTVAYQPICGTDGRLLAAEALVRWDHPTRGRLLPDEFIGVAERYRLTQLIAERVLDVGLSDLARWRTRDPGLTTSVNISASDLRDESIVHVVAKALLTHRVPPEALTIEITETDMMRDPAMAQRVMHALADLGVELSVDDYGTGYSSLEYLLKLPVNEIKLDRAFSTNLERGLRSVEIVRSTVLLTHALGLRMVAEGVETEATLATLRQLGCDRVQGWHLGRPMTATAFSLMVGQVPAVRPAPVL